MTRVYLGIGSNMGNRRRNIQQAIAVLKEHAIRVTKVSRIIETNPVGGPPQPKYLNAALEADTQLNPAALLFQLKKIERKMGRKKTVRNGPRPIDIDILLYGKRIIRTKKLIVPHPRMPERDFVMKPLNEIAPKIAGRYLKKSKL